MTDLLTFLNTADADTLTQVSGVTNTIAENIIAARPFESVDDCLKVKGIEKPLLSKLELFAENQENESGNRDLIPVREEATPIYVDQSQSAQENVKEETSFFSRFGKVFGNFLRTLIRLIATILFIVLIGAGLYYGIPFFYENFIEPTQQNTIRINELEIQISALQTQQSDLDSRLSAVENTIESYSASITKLEEMQSTIESELQENNNSVLLELKREVMLARAFDMLGRARLYLSQSNFGLAQEDVQSARDVLFALQTETNDAVLSEVVSRLDLALSNLPQFPVVASGDLEIAWQILMTGEANAVATSTPTPFAEPFLTATPTPFDVPSVTPTP